jgi:dockerin type I repeat protein
VALSANRRQLRTYSQAFSAFKRLTWPLTVSLSQYANHFELAKKKMPLCSNQRPTLIRREHLPLLVGTVLVVCLSGIGSSARAAFHLWQVKEVFSNADGSVQFVELFDSFSGETSMSGKTLKASSDGNIKTFTFPSNLTHSTPGSLLLATTGFGSLAGGVTPDFTFSQGGVSGTFFNPNATNLTFTFSGSGDTMTFAGAALPKNGISSLTDSGAIGSPPGTPNITSGVNSPTNLNGNSGSVNLSTPSPTGDYNGNHTVDAADYAIWRKTLNGTVSPNGNGADGSSNGTIDTADYTFWRARFGNPAGSGSGSLLAGSVPEPSTLLLQFNWLLVWMWRARIRSTISGE